MAVRPARALLVAALVPLGLVAACSDDGREMRPPGPDQTLSIITTTSAVAPATVDTADPDTGTLIALRLPFGDGERIEPKYTCKGADVSPAVSWENIPVDATEVALSVIDLDSNPPGFVHWVITGLDPASAGIAEGAVPKGAVQAANDFGSTEWNGPCPPTGEHTYLFTLYALDSSPGIVEGQDGQGAISSIEDRQVASVALAGIFGSA